MKTVTAAISEFWPRFHTLPDVVTEAEYDAIRAGTAVELTDESAAALIALGIVKEEKEKET